MENLSSEQRNALTTFVNKIRELLRICAHGGIPIEADEFMEECLTPGRLLAVCRLFQERDDTTVSGYCGPLRFPGSVVWDCNPFIRELAGRWIPYHNGNASPSDVAFPTPEQERNEAFAFRKLNEYVSFLENVLQNRESSGTEADESPAETEPATGVQDATPAIMPQQSTRNKTQRRWTVPEVEERIRLELNSGNAANEELYLFASADDLESLIGCNRKTAMDTVFWTEERDEKQREWRRKNTAGKRTRKRDI